MDYTLRMVGVGALLGFLSGLFGVGGSSVATPILRLMDVPRMFALATPLPVTLPVAIVGAVTYMRRGLVNWRVALLTAAGGVPAVIAGAKLTTFVPPRLLMALTGLFVAGVGVRLLTQMPDAAHLQKPAVVPTWLLLVVGVAVGFLSGLLANGGGFLLVPAYLLVFGMPTKEAAATSLVAVALLALPGTWEHWQLGHIDPHLALLLAIGVVPTTYLGARVGISLKGSHSRLLFGIFVLTFGVFFLARIVLRAELYGWLD